jgi:hypothetical protein
MDSHKDFLPTFLFRLSVPIMGKPQTGTVERPGVLVSSVDGYVWFANLFVLTGLFIGQCRVGQFMVQNCKVVHWPDKQPETAELKWLIRDESIQSSALSYPNRILLLLLTISCPV